MVDTRGATVVLSITDLYELGVTLTSHPALRQSKIGLLAPMSDMDRARFFETVAHNRGAAIQAFIDFEQAITWLALRDAAS